MMKIEVLDKVVKGEIDVRSAGVSYRLLDIYEDNIDTDNDCLNIDRHVYKECIGELVSDMRKFGIESFSLSNSYFGLEEIDEFVQNGCELQGFVNVEVAHRFDKEIKRALLLKVA